MRTAPLTSNPEADGRDERSHTDDGHGPSGPPRGADLPPDEFARALARLHLVLSRLDESCGRVAHFRETLTYTLTGIADQLGTLLEACQEAERLQDHARPTLLRRVERP
jgi:hypothetical protein